MNSLERKMGYINGLMDGLKLNKNDDVVKILYLMADALSDVTDELEKLHRPPHKPPMPMHENRFRPPHRFDDEFKRAAFAFDDDDDTFAVDDSDVSGEGLSQSDCDEDEPEDKPF